MASLEVTWTQRFWNDTLSCKKEKQSGAAQMSRMHGVQRLLVLALAIASSSALRAKLATRIVCLTCRWLGTRLSLDEKKLRTMYEIMSNTQRQLCETS